MAMASVARTPLIRLVRELGEEVRVLIRQEVKLAKTEVSEKVSRFGKGAVSVAVGGFVAYAGLIVLLAGLGVLIGFGLEKAGLDRLLAGCLGLAIIGLIVGMVGYIVLSKGLKAFSQESLAPEKTVHTLQQMTKGEPTYTPRYEHAEADEPEEPEQSSTELERNVNVTQAVVGETVAELGRRMTPHYVNTVVKGQVRKHPAPALLIAFSTGLAGSLMLLRRSRHAHA